VLLIGNCFSTGRRDHSPPAALAQGRNPAGTLGHLDPAPDCKATGARRLRKDKRIKIDGSIKPRWWQRSRCDGSARVERAARWTRGAFRPVPTRAAERGATARSASRSTVPPFSGRLRRVPGMFGFSSRRKEGNGENRDLLRCLCSLLLDQLTVHFGKIVFQSSFMLITVQPLAAASSRPLSSLPMCESRS